MSMENELKRIADALERIADAKAVPASTTTTMVDPPAPAPKKASTKKATPAPESPEGDSTGPKTGGELMSYCNTKLVGIKDPAQRASTIKEVIKMFGEKYGVKAIRELEDAKVQDAKTDFDALVGGA